MTTNTNEAAWTKLGADLLAKWQAANGIHTPLTQNELDAFDYAWDLAYQNRALLQNEPQRGLGW